MGKQYRPSKRWAIVLASLPGLQCGSRARRLEGLVATAIQDLTNALQAGRNLTGMRALFADPGTRMDPAGNRSGDLLARR